MRKLLIISALLLPLLGIGQSASYNPENNSMTKCFTASKLDESEIGPFQVRAVQKLQDFYNYLSIISNPAYDKKLREQAETQAKQLFYSSDCAVNGKPYKDFIDSCLSLKKRVEWKAVDVAIKEKMALKSNAQDSSYYEGALSFKISSGTTVSIEKKAYMIIAKCEKMFGTEKKDVWSVFICSIE